MKASGPFAMGPSLVGRRPARSNFTPLMPSGPSKGGTLGSGLTRTTAPTLGVKKEPGSKGDTKAESDEEVYSDPDEGVEIVDMQNIRKMDWMAPETLKRESEYKRRVKLKKDDKKSLAEQAGLDRGEGLCRDFVLGESLTSTSEDMDVDEMAADDVNLANAVNLSGSEDEVEEEQIAGDFFNQDPVRVRPCPPRIAY